nr:unnamed protein product [Callosobruchus analis]
MASRVPRIDMNPKKTNSKYYLKKAQHFCVEHNYPKAYEYFVHYFERLNDTSEVSSTVQAIFTKLVCKIATVLEETNNVEELLKCYLQTINLFPNNHVILNQLGAYMFKVGEIDIARRYLELSVKADQHFLPAERNLLHLRWHEIPRWHFRMMNDKQRNEAYEKAITLLINKGFKNVVDIGAGCGLLSLIASKGPEACCVAIEENKVLAKMCKDILADNNVGNVKVMNCHSTDINDPLDKCNLLVTETFDVALFGERVLESIHHALSTLKTEEDFKIVPARAKLYITGISSPELHSKYQYVPKQCLKRLHLDDICLSHREWEPYEAEYLTERNYEFVTETQQIFEVNFSDQQQVYNLLNGKGEHQLIQLKCKEGVIHALVLWFDLYLTEDIWITTNPTCDNCAKCWEQAIIYLDHSAHAKEGNMLTLAISMEDCKLNVTALNEEPVHECFKVSKDIISILNDQKLVDTYISIADSFADRQLDVIDFNTFPLVGLLLAKNGCQVYHMIKNEADRSFFEHILRVNSIPPESFLLLQEGARCIDLDLIKPNSLIVSDVINSDGYLDDDFVQKNEIAGMIYLPKTVKIVAMMVYAPYIDCCNKVDDQNTLGFKIAKFMNQYSGFEHPNIEKLIGEPRTKYTCFTLQDGVRRKPVTVVRTGFVNAVYCWYEIQYYDRIKFSTFASSHYKKTCFFMKDAKMVTNGDTVYIQIEVDSSVIKITGLP